MGERIRLPDGTYITIPEGLTPEQKAALAARLAKRFNIPAQDERASSSRQIQRSKDNPFADYKAGENPFIATDSGIMSLNPSTVKPREIEPPDDGTIAGAAWQGIKNLPRGMMQYSLLARQGLAGLTSPDEDTDKEKELRRKMQDLMEGIDPRYQDSRLANLGLGLGQFGAMIGTSLIPYVGGAIALGGAGLSGAGQQANRIHQYEQDTGEDVSSEKERAALAMGLGLGFTEMMPWGKAIKALRPATKMSGSLKAEILEEGLEETASAIDRVRGNIIATSIGQGIMEGAQEAAAGYGQSKVAQMMYDEDAMADAYHEAMKEAVIGFDVGAVGNVLLHMATKGKNKGLKNVFSNVASESLGEARERQLESMEEGEVDALFRGFLNSEDPEAIDMRQKIASGEAQDNLLDAFDQRRKRLAEVRDAARQKRQRGEINAEQLQEAENNYDAQLKEAGEAYANSYDRLAFRKKAIEMHAAGTLKGMPNAKAPTEAPAPVEQLEQVETIVKAAETGQELTEQDAEVVATANVDTADRATYSIGELVGQIRSRLRPNKEEVTRTEQAVVNQEVVELERERVTLKQAIESTDNRIKRYDERLAESDRLAKRIEDLSAKIAKADGEKLLELEVDRADVQEQLGEVNKALANTNRENLVADKGRQEQNLEAKRAQIEVASDPENVKKRVENAEENLTLGNDDLLSIEERLLTQQQRDALRALHARFMRVTFEDGTTGALPADMTVAEAEAQGAQVVESNEKLTARQVREILEAIFTGGLAQQYDVAYETSKGVQRESPDWTLTEAESDGPVTYEVASIDENIAPTVVRGEGDQTYNTPVTEGMQLSREEFQTVQAQIEGALAAEAQAVVDQEATLTKKEIAARKRKNTTAKKQLKKWQAEVAVLTKKIIQETENIRSRKTRSGKLNAYKRREKAKTRLNKLETELIPAKQEEIANTEVATPQKRKKFEAVTVVSREAIERSAGKKSQEQLTQKKRPFVNNAARIESGQPITPVESEGSKRTRDSILIRILGFRAVYDYAKLQGKYRDKPGEIELERLEDVNLVDADTKLLTVEFEETLDDNNNKQVTESLVKRFMANKGININFDEFVADTLGYDVGAIQWSETTEGERQAVIARILDTNIPQTTRKSYTNQSRIPAVAGRNILATLARKTKQGKYQNWSLRKKDGEPTKTVVDIANANGLTIEETLDFIDRAVTAGVLTQKGNKVRFNTTKEFKADIDAKDTEKGRKVKVLQETENLSEQQAQDREVVKKRLTAFKIRAIKALEKMGHGDVAVRVAVTADTIYAKAAEIIADPDIIIDYQSSRGTDASLQDHNTMVLFNYSQMELSHPIREGESENDYVNRLVTDFALHEGAHLYFVKKELSASDRGVFARYGRREFVPESVLPENTGPNKLTWRQWVESLYPELTESELTEEATVRIMDALVQDKIPQNKSAGRIGTVQKKLLDVSRALVGASRASDLGEVMKIFSKIQNGELTRRQDAKKEEGNTTSIDGLKLVERATEEQLRDLKAASGMGKEALERASDDILASRVDPETGAVMVKNKDGDWVDQESGKKFESVSLMDSMLNDLKARKEIEDTPSISAPVLNMDALESGQISPESLDAYFAFETQKEPPLQFFEGTRRHKSQKVKGESSPQTKARRETANLHKTKGPAEKDKILPPGQALVEAGHSNDELAPELQEETGQKYVSDGRTFGKHIKYHGLELFRERFLDKRLPMWKAEMAKARENALKQLSEFSAMVAWRMHDNALNFLPGILKYGPMSYKNGGFSLENVYAVDPETGEYRRDANGKKIQVKGLREIVKVLTDNKIDMQLDVKDIVMARRILQAQARGQTKRVARLTKKIHKDVNKALGMAQATMDAFQANVDGADGDALLIDQFMQEYSDFNYYLIEFAYDAGMITESQKADFQQSAYFPFYRDQGWVKSDNMENQNGPRRKGAPLIDKALEGSNEPVSDDLMGMMVKNVVAITRDSMWNIAAQRTMRDQMQTGRLEDPDTGKVWYDAVELTGDYSDSIPEDLSGEQLKEWKENQKAAQRELSDAGYSDIVVTLKQDGLTRRFRTRDPLLAKSMMSVGFSAEQTIENFFGKVIQNEKLRKGLTWLAVKPAGFLRETVTKSPPFIAKNIVRDAWQASVTYGGGPQLLVDAIKNVFDAEAMEKAQRHGLGIGIDWTPDTSRAGEGEIAAMKPLDQLGTFEQAFEMMWMRPIWRPLGRASQRSEIATRLAVFDRVLADNNGDATMAAYQAIEIMNYGRRGSSQFFNVITAMAPFLNGRIQGTDVTFRTMIGSADVPGLYDGQTGGDLLGKAFTPSAELRRKSRAIRVATALGRGSQLALLTGLYYWMIKDEEEYKNAREDLKNDYWIFPGMGPAGTGIKIPIPFEIGFFFKVIPEQIARAIFEEEHDMRDVRDESVRQIRATMNFNLVPQTIRPFIDASIRNRNAFIRDNIVPSWMEDSVAPVDQSNEYTNHLAVLTAGMLDEIPLIGSISEKLGLTSPMKLEYIARQFVGTLGSYGLVAGDRIARHATGQNYVGTAADFLGSSTMEIDRMPIIGDLLFDPGMGGGYQEDFYKIVEQLDKVIATMGQREQRDPDAAYEYSQEQKELLDHESRLKYFRRRMDHHREERQALFDRKDLSDDDKRRMLYRMTEDRDHMLTEMLEIMAEIRKDRSTYEKLFGRGP